MYFIVPDRAPWKNSLVLNVFLPCINIFEIKNYLTIQNFNGVTVEVLESMSNFIPQFSGHVTTYS